MVGGNFSCRKALVASTQDAMKVLKAGKANYESLEKQLSASGDTQISRTDPAPFANQTRPRIVGVQQRSVGSGRREQGNSPPTDFC